MNERARQGSKRNAFPAGKPSDSIHRSDPGIGTVWRNLSGMSRFCMAWAVRAFAIAAGICGLSMNVQPQ